MGEFFVKLFRSAFFWNSFGRILLKDFMRFYQCSQRSHSICASKFWHWPFGSHSKSWGVDEIKHLPISIDFFFPFGFPFANIHESQDAEKGEGISLTPHYLFHPLHRHLSITQVMLTSPLHITSSWTRTKNFWFPSTSC